MKTPLYLFDMGGVVASNVHVLPELTAALGMSEAEFLAVCGSPGAWGSPDQGLLAALQTGTLGSREFWPEFCRRTGKPTPREDLWRTLFRPEPITGTVAVIANLRGSGFRVVCATNTLDVHFEVHRDRGDYAVFDRVYASHQLGVAKPTPEFWQTILTAEGCPPGQAVFIDDALANVEAARTLGLMAHRFTSPQALARDLGVRLPD